ncbi:hypothetical protein Ahy_A02g006103 isoform A [Arachis hypogaea]|uniref:Adenylate isopentenyltransferase n=1 Tax=Arachis hypogaea TaxID=3818 RepID=A0A445E9E9_ARAHY|nr:hypothetical protein Ahy_A02g006103 isoform A [Arachis hypogaea]
MGATGAGKSKLSVDLATCFPSEIINSDKIQVYEGLDIVTNKISKEEQKGVPHHLLGTQNVQKRVDQMYLNGMVNELRPFFNPNNKDYSIGIRKAIGVPEFDEYFRRENVVDEETKQRLLDEAINEIKVNTCNLARKQFGKIQRLRNVKRWKIHRLDATPVFQKHGQEANKAWNKFVLEPSAMIIAKFLYNNNSSSSSSSSSITSNNRVVSGFSSSVPASSESVVCV